MQPIFSYLDVVNIITDAKPRLAMILETVMTTDTISYIVQTADNQELIVKETDMQFVNRLHPPFDWYEIVELMPADIACADLTGSKAVVSGLAHNFAVAEWTYSVVTQDGVNWCFSATELKPTGFNVDPGVVDQAPDVLVRVQVNDNTGEGVSDDTSFTKQMYSYKPLPLDLDEYVLANRKHNY